MKRAKAKSIEFALQLAALPWRPAANSLEILLVTSRVSRHWLIPKGWPMVDKTDAQAALQEAYEEAGVMGTASQQPLGNYRYTKVFKDESSVKCRVDVYAMAVTQELDRWPERKQRERKWLAPEQAAEMVNEAGLARFLRDVAEGKFTFG